MKNGKYLILCVDDDNDILEALRLRLNKAGYLTETALSAEEGLKKFKETQPDLIIADECHRGYSAQELGVWSATLDHFDATKIGEMLAEHGSVLLAAARLITLNDAEAEDVVQDTVIAAWNGRAGFRGQSALRTWLVGILNHKIVDLIREFLGVK